MGCISFHINFNDRFKSLKSQIFKKTTVSWFLIVFLKCDLQRLVSFLTVKSRESFRTIIFDVFNFPLFKRKLKLTKKITIIIRKLPKYLVELIKKAKNLNKAN